MAEEEVRQDSRTVEQIVDDMSLFDDDLMSMVFDGNIEATELLLKIILKKNDIIVINVVGQREFQSPVVGGRDIRLDIWAKDSVGKHYDVDYSDFRFIPINLFRIRFYKNSKQVCRNNYSSNLAQAD